jgi:hypothetical protein
MPPKRRSGAGKTPASRAKGNTVAKCLAAIGVEDAAKALEGCESLDAEFRVLKSSYHRAVLRAHPDKGGDREVFEDIQNSFEVLRGMFANREVDSFVQAAASRKSTARAFEFAEATRPKSTPSWEYYAAAAEETVPIYRVEPAKSGRSACSMAARGPNTRCVRGAPFKIPKGELRVGSIDEEAGAYSRWVHLECWRVPAKIHQGLPRLGSPEAEDPTAFEAALLSMNEVLLSGVEELEPEIRQLLVRHVMDPTKWAALQVKKIVAPRGGGAADKAKGKGKGKGKRAAPEPSPAVPVPSVPVDAGASKKAKSSSAPSPPLSREETASAMIVRLRELLRTADVHATTVSTLHAALREEFGARAELTKAFVKRETERFLVENARRDAAAAAARRTEATFADAKPSKAKPSKAKPSEATASAVVRVAAPSAASSRPSTAVARGGGGKQLFSVPRPGQGLCAPGALRGKTVVLTGIFPELGGGAGLDLGKARARALVESFGGRVTSSVSGRTDALLVGKDPGMSKVTKARNQSGCALVNLQQLCGELTGGRGLPDKGSREAGELTRDVGITSFSGGYRGNGLAWGATNAQLAYAAGMDARDYHVGKNAGGGGSALGWR